MKTIFKSIIYTILVLACVQDLSAQSIFDEWKEIDAFHEIMSSTYHPAENGDLEPIKSKCGELAKQAVLVSESSIPASFDSPELRDAVKSLQKQSKSLNKLISKGKSTDDEIKDELESLHDVFHKIVGLCTDEEH